MIETLPSEYVPLKDVDVLVVLRESVSPTDSVSLKDTDALVILSVIVSLKEVVFVLVCANVRKLVVFEGVSVSDIEADGSYVGVSGNGMVTDVRLRDSLAEIVDSVGDSDAAETESVSLREDENLDHVGLEGDRLVAESEAVADSEAGLRDGEIDRLTDDDDECEEAENEVFSVSETEKAVSESDKRDERVADVWECDRDFEDEFVEVTGSVGVTVRTAWVATGCHAMTSNARSTAMAGIGEGGRLFVFKIMING